MSLSYYFLVVCEIPLTTDRLGPSLFLSHTNLPRYLLDRTQLGDSEENCLNRESTLDDIPKVEKKTEPKVEKKTEPKVEKKTEPKVEKKTEPKVEIPESVVETLLRPHETIRDPIYGDISITLLERAIIDTPLFQRLRGKLQLGPTHLVYHGATHTRFAHSIGTLHIAKEMVDICNSNFRNYANPNLIEISLYNELIIRLYALLHDAAHIPFGHTCEREGNLFSNHEWEDEVRADKILGEGSVIRDRMTETLKLFGLDERQISRVIDDLHTVLTWDHKDDPMNFDEPFITDIVGNTLCADLLDYSVRDMYYCGLAERWGDRFLKFIAVLPVEKVKSEREEYRVKPLSKGGKGRLVLLSYRYERDRSDPRQSRMVSKSDVLSEAIDLLRKRYSLAQKVYFHRTKKAASAMIISAIKEEGLRPADLLEMTCDQLVATLCNSKNPRVRNIATNYLERKLYKVIYEIKYKKEVEDDKDSRKLWNEIVPIYRDPDKRIRAERKMESDFGLDLGSLIIYCPKRGMNVKQIEMLVQTAPDNPVAPLREILDDTRKEEMEVIDKYFNRLWSLQVLVDPQKLDPSEVQNPNVRVLSGYCEELFGLPNDHSEDLRGTRTDFSSARIHAWVVEWNEKNPERSVPYIVVERIKAVASRYDENNLKELRDELHRQVEEHYGKPKVDVTSK